MTTASSKDKELIENYFSTQDPSLREEIVLRYVPLVHYTLNRLGISADIGKDYEDMASQGLIGLIDALDRFDPNYGTQFSTYAMIKIRGKILDYMRSLDWLTRTARQRAKVITEAVNTFWGNHQRMPSDAELADVLKINISEVQTALVDSSRVLVSLDAYDDTENTEDLSMHETLADSSQSDPADIMDEQETKTRLIEAIQLLPDREQLLLSLYYYDNLTFKEIGEVLGVSESRVCQLHARAALSLKTIISLEENSAPNDKKKAIMMKNFKLRQQKPRDRINNMQLYINHYV